MPVVPVTAPPFVPVAPRIRLGDATTGVDIECAAGELSVEAEQDETVTETFCGSYTTYKAKTWTITVNAFMSYGAAGLWTLVNPLCNGVPIAFSILPDKAGAVSVSNPIMSGMALVKQIPFYMGAVGEPTAFDIEIAVQGTPTFAITGTFMAEGMEADESEVDESELVDA